MFRGGTHTALACRLILSTGVLSSTFQHYRLRVIARVQGTWSSNCDRGTVGDDHPVARDRTKRVFFIYRRHRPALDAPGARAARGLAIVARVSPGSRLVQEARAGAGGAAGERRVAGVEWEIRQGDCRRESGHSPATHDGRAWGGLRGQLRGSGGSTKTTPRTRRHVDRGRPRASW